MAIAIGDKLPDGTLWEAVEFDEAAGCPLNPQKIDIAAATTGKRIVVFGLPGAYTPTCSAQHLPGYVENFDAFKAKGVDEIWCVAVNDAFVMGAWGRSQGVSNKVRMLGDGNGDWARALGLELDRTAGGMGKRMERFSMLVDNGVVTQLNVEAPREFKVSAAATMLGQLG